MKSLAIRGAVLALFGALTIGLGQLFGLNLDAVALLGVALGGVIGLVQDRSQIERIGGFFVGFVLVWIAYAARAGFVPDTSGSRAVVLVVVILAATGICVATSGRLPFWSMLVGIAALVGSYEETYTIAPPLFIEESPTAATSVLLAVAMGVLATMLFGKEITGRRRAESDDSEIDDSDRND
ncbi:MAG: hypothetical protein ACXWDJ_07625, partial [Aeromicrobium sp.]